MRCLSLDFEDCQCNMHKQMQICNDCLESFYNLPRCPECGSLDADFMDAHEYREMLTGGLDNDS